MGDDRLLITGVSSRLLAHDIAERYGLMFWFVRPLSAKCPVDVMRVFGEDKDSALDTLSADKFNSMTVQDLEDMCEYWKMVEVFSHG
jgi:hypothetical protein